MVHSALALAFMRAGGDSGFVPSNSYFQQRPNPPPWPWPRRARRQGLSLAAWLLAGPLGVVGLGLEPVAVGRLAVPRAAADPAPEEGPTVAAASQLDEPGTLRNGAEPKIPQRGLDLDGPGQGVGLRAELNDAEIDWEANPVMTRLGKMARTATWSRYTHGFRVDEQAGRYWFDCSGMVQWVLEQAAPRAAVTSAWGLNHRPLARNFYNQFTRLPLSGSGFGWSRVERVADIQAGDVVVWLTPKSIRSSNTGHVSFAVQPPVPFPGKEDRFLVRTMDSTRLPHRDDKRFGQRPGSRSGGLGLGTIALATDGDGRPRAYSWGGEHWYLFRTSVAIARPLD